MGDYMNAENSIVHEKSMFAMNGWLALFVNFLFVGFAFISFISGGLAVILGVVSAVVAFIMLFGYFILQPNEGTVSTFFGKYSGSFKEDGFYWTNPLYSKNKISLKISNYNSAILKVNDKRGNPIEIGSVISWYVAETAQALFTVEDYHQFLVNQSESAIREVATSYAYDHIKEEDGEMTLRGNLVDISRILQKSIQEHVKKAGIVVSEAKIVHLAYAQEIAQAMLRRQQAEAVVAARQRIVEGAVTMTESAINQLKEHNILEMTQQTKEALVINMMTVLVGEGDAQPMIPLSQGK